MIFRGKQMAFLMLMAFGLWASVTHAHKFHHSFAEATVNSDRQTLEVALKVIPEDLETALESQVGKRVNLESTKDIDQEIIKYLWASFQFSSETGHQLDMVWVGKEITHKAAWLYFEIPYKTEKTLTIKNTILDGVSHGQQINTLVVTRGDEKIRLVFGDGKNTHRLELSSQE
ncbi:hypothetical protein QP938_11580 [Porticoccaceae bacterium LTM1]|nr:hypothetical protein QP938_11580 [Porticoccaceae bacterium LTM1]